MSAHSPDPPPLVALPTTLSPEAAAAILELLHETARVIENHYAAELQRHHRHQHELWPEHDPPF